MENNKSLVHPIDRREQSIQTWERAYLLTLKSEPKFIARLKELETWDTSNGHEYERQVKIQALKNLLGK